MRCAVRMRSVSGAQLINFLRTWGEQRTPVVWKGHLAHPVFFVFAQKLTNFGLWQTVCELFTNGAAQVRSPIYTYTHLVCKPFASDLLTIQRARVYEALTLVYTSALLMCCAVRVWHIFGARLINFPRTCGEQRTLSAWKDTWRIQFSFCSHKKPTNFGLRWMVCKPFADGAAQVRSPIHPYAHLFCEPFGALVYTRF